MPNARWPMSCARSARAPHDDSPQMPKPTRNRRDVNAELREVIAQGAPWVRRAEFVPMTDGSLRRRITRHDGTVEKDDDQNPGQVVLFRNCTLTPVLVALKGRPEPHRLLWRRLAYAARTVNLRPSARHTRDTVSKRGWAPGRRAL